MKGILLRSENNEHGKILKPIMSEKIKLQKNIYIYCVTQFLKLWKQIINCLRIVLCFFKNINEIY